MTVFIDGHACGYELQRLTQMFFPGEKVAVEQGAPPEDFAGDFLHARYREGLLEAVSRLGDGSPRALRAEAPAGGTAGLEHRFGVLAYTLLSEGTGVRPPWGCSPASVRSSSSRRGWRKGWTRRPCAAISWTSGW